MPKEIQFTPTQIWGVTGSPSGKTRSGTLPRPSVQATGTEPKDKSPAVGILAVIAWLVVLRIVWEVVS